MEKKIAELHKLHKGQTPAEAEFNFLDHARRIDMYGVELHKAKDNTNKEIDLGVTHIGLVVCQNNIRINTFSWSKIMKISFKRKQFFIQLIREPVSIGVSAVRHHSSVFSSRKITTLS
jgi:tyrosine-protein phosphatase non-receptor type 4